MADEIPDLTGTEERTDHDLGIVRENLTATENRIETEPLKRQPEVPKPGMKIQDATRRIHYERG